VKVFSLPQAANQEKRSRSVPWSDILIRALSLSALVGYPDPRAEISGW
jgi:hypothetical protein